MLPGCCCKEPRDNTRPNHHPERYANPSHPKQAQEPPPPKVGCLGIPVIMAARLGTLSALLRLEPEPSYTQPQPPTKLQPRGLKKSSKPLPSSPPTGVSFPLQALPAAGSVGQPFCGQPPLKNTTVHLPLPPVPGKRQKRANRPPTPSPTPLEAPPFALT